MTEELEGIEILLKCDKHLVFNVRLLYWLTDVLSSIYSTTVWILPLLCQSLPSCLHRIFFVHWWCYPGAWNISQLPKLRSCFDLVWNPQLRTSMTSLEIKPRIFRLLSYGLFYFRSLIHLGRQSSITIYKIYLTPGIAKIFWPRLLTRGIYDFVFQFLSNSD